MGISETGVLKLVDSDLVGRTYSFTRVGIQMRTLNSCQLSTLPEHRAQKHLTSVTYHCMLVFVFGQVLLMAQRRIVKVGVYSALTVTMFRKLRLLWNKRYR